MSARGRTTPDAHLFPTRPYDLVKEAVVAIAVVGVLVLALAAVFSSPDKKAVTLAAWAKAAPEDVARTAVTELDGTSGSATYGPPYNHASNGQKLGPLGLQKAAGVRTPVDSADDLVIDPLARSTAGNPGLAAALARWRSADATQRLLWASAYDTALGKAAGGSPARVAKGDYGPAPTLATEFVRLARSGALEGLLTTSDTFYGSNETKPLLLLADGSYLESLARADNLGGDQWGMMNEVGNYPGQPWLWLYTFWYQVKPFSTSDNADALVWGLMVALSLVLLFLPWIPGLRSLPRLLGVHKLIWRAPRATHRGPPDIERLEPARHP